MNIDNLITSIPINLFDSLYNHNITSSQEIKLYKEHNYFNIRLDDNVEFNYLIETKDGNSVRTYESIYTNIESLNYDSSYCSLFTLSCNDIDTLKITSENIDTSYISMNDISINNLFKGKNVDISYLFINNTIDISDTINNYNINLNKDSFINFDKNKSKCKVRYFWTNRVL